MNAMRLMGIVLLVGGILGLMYGGFTYTKETHEAKIGSVVIAVKDKETVNVPIWAGVAAVVVGGLLVAAGAEQLATLLPPASPASALAPAASAR